MDIDSNRLFYWPIYYYIYLTLLSHQWLQTFSCYDFSVKTINIIFRYLFISISLIYLHDFSLGLFVCTRNWIHEPLPAISHFRNGNPLHINHTTDFKRKIVRRRFSKFKIDSATLGTSPIQPPISGADKLSTLRLSLVPRVRLLLFGHLSLMRWPSLLPALVPRGFPSLLRLFVLEVLRPSRRCLRQS